MLPLHLLLSLFIHTILYCGWPVFSSLDCNEENSRDSNLDCFNLLLSQVFLIYSVEKFLEEDNRFKWPAYISGGLLTLLSISCGLEHIEDC